MKGTEKAHLFTTGQYGRLYITSGSHARGRTLRIQVLPKDEVAIPNGSQNTCLNKNAVMVYDVVCGQRGWTEVYGWLHDGKWQEDFNNLVVEKEKELVLSNIEREKRIKEAEEKANSEITNLLKEY